MDDGITIREFEEAEGTADWRVVSDGACAFFSTGSFAESVRLVAAIAAIPGVGDHCPDLDVRRDGVTARLLTEADDWYGMSRRDAEMAARISAAAREAGFTADPRGIQSILVIPGAPGGTSVVAFWQAVLGYDRRPDSPEEDLVDPRRRGPAFWFEEMAEPRADGGGGIHVGVWVPAELAEERVKAALAAGGHLVRDQFAPSWWTLADAAGNEADVATAQGRD